MHTYMAMAPATVLCTIIYYVYLRSSHRAPRRVVCPRLVLGALIPDTLGGWNRLALLAADVAVFILQLYRPGCVVEGGCLAICWLFFTLGSTVLLTCFRRLPPARRVSVSLWYFPVCFSFLFFSAMHHTRRRASLIFVFMFRNAPLPLCVIVILSLAVKGTKWDWQDYAVRVC